MNFFDFIIFLLMLTFHNNFTLGKFIFPPKTAAAPSSNSNQLINKFMDNFFSLLKVNQPINNSIETYPINLKIRYHPKKKVVVCHFRSEK